MLSNLSAEQLFFVDTVEKAGRADVRLYDVRDIKIDEKALFRLCNNAVNWGEDFTQQGSQEEVSSWNYHAFKPGQKTEDGDPTPYMEGVHEIPNRNQYYRYISSRHHLCTIYKSEHNAGDDFHVFYKWIEDSSLVQYRPMEPWQSLPHFTKLSKLAKE
jgi:hypothetical protein